jgi:hypothetical protein
MYSATRQVDIAQTAARIFIRENAKNIPYETTIVSGNDFADLLEPYGLPLGFVPRTPLGQDITLVIHKTPMSVSAYLELSGGDLSGIQIAELARRIGFYATPVEKKIQVGIELAEIYSDVVRRNETDLDNSGFLSDNFLIAVILKIDFFMVYSPFISFLLILNILHQLNAVYVLFPNLRDNCVYILKFPGFHHIILTGSFRF